MSRLFFFFFNDTATTEIYTLSLHDALPILRFAVISPEKSSKFVSTLSEAPLKVGRMPTRSEEHTSELQSRQYLVCRLLLEKKKENLEPKSHRASLLTALARNIRLLMSA